MSKFQYLFKRLIADSEKSSSLARTIGAETHFNSKVPFDERILSYKTVQALARHLIFPLMNEKIFSAMISFFKARKRTTNGRPSAVLLNNLASVDFSMAPPPECLL